MFEVDMKEAKERVVDIKEVDPNVLRELLRFLYQGEVEMSPKMSMRLYELADRYLMQDLKENCLYYMVHHITVLNVVDLFCLAKKHDLRTLCAKSKSFFAM
jgi:speckle-type POZ protein